MGGKEIKQKYINFLIGVNSKPKSSYCDIVLMPSSKYGGEVRRRLVRVQGKSVKGSPKRRLRVESHGEGEVQGNSSAEKERSGAGKTMR